MSTTESRTSTVLALATMFDLDIVTIPLSRELTDSVFNECVDHISDNSILLLEDFDRLFEDPDNPSNRVKTGLSLQAILNTLDGVETKNRITILTTNNIKHLDPALIRTGRINRILNFDEMKSAQIREMCLKFVPDQKDAQKEFVKKCRNRKVTPAILQQFLHQVRKKDSVLENMNVLDDIIKVHSTSDDSPTGMYN